MKRSWGYILKPAKIIGFVDLLALLTLGVPAIFVGSLFDSIPFNLGNRLYEWTLLLLAIFSVLAVTISFYRFLLSLNLSRVWRFVLTLLSFVVLSLLFGFIFIVILVSTSWPA